MVGDGTLSKRSRGRPKIHDRLDTSDSDIVSGVYCPSLESTDLVSKLRKEQVRLAQRRYREGKGFTFAAIKRNAENRRMH